jgi:hypothetical protein
MRNRHTLVEPAEFGAGDEVIMRIAGHVSRAMMRRYSHVRMEASQQLSAAPIDTAQCFTRIFDVITTGAEAIMTQCRNVSPSKKP